ncbi:hypothetical protein FP367_01375 [Klebsiella pneumoniae]|nr:hypothetical protein [Klebsiella pneumoniae]
MPCNLLNHTSHLTVNQMKHVAFESFLNEVVLTFIKLYLLLIRFRVNHLVKSRHDRSVKEVCANVNK